MCGTLIAAISFSFMFAFVTFAATVVITDMISASSPRGDGTCLKLLYFRCFYRLVLLISWGSGLFYTTVGGSCVLTSLSVLIVDPKFRPYLVPGGTLQEPLPGEVVVVPLADEAGLGLHPGDLHVAPPELTLSSFG